MNCKRVVFSCLFITIFILSNAFGKDNFIKSQITDGYDQEIIKLGQSSNILPFLIKITDDAKKNNRDLKLQVYSAFANLLIPCQSLSYRLHNISSKEKMVESSILDSIRELKKSTSYKYGKNVMAVFDYLTLPQNEIYKERKFEKISEVQDFLTNNIVRRIDYAINNLDLALNEMADNQYIEFNKKIIYGEDSFAGNTEEPAISYLTKGDLLSAKSLLEYSKFYIFVISSYDLDLLMNYMSEAFFVQSGAKIFEAFTGITPAYRNYTLNKSKFQKLLTLRQKGPEYMKNALSNLTASIKDRLKGVQFYRNNSFSENYSFLINPVYEKASAKDNEKKMAELLRIFNNQGPAVVVSKITGKKITINPAALFLNPAQDLKKLLPTAFADKKVDKWNSEKKSSNMNFEAINPESGMPTAFPDYTLNDFFPESSNIKDLYTTLKIFYESNSGEFFEPYMVAILGHK